MSVSNASFRAVFPRAVERAVPGRRGGLLGWGFAAVVTFAAEFSRDAQLVLAYTCGGLPFALVAAMLLRPLRANLATGALTVVAVAIGSLLASDNPFGLDVLQLCVVYLQYLIGPVTAQ